MRDSLLARAVVVLVLLGLLLVPLRMIQGLVAEREARRRAAVDEIGATWGGPQTLVGPVLVLPHRVLRRENVVLAPPAGSVSGAPGLVQESTRVETAYAAFLPERLKVEGTLVPERRRRGIFEVAVYARRAGGQRHARRAGRARARPRPRRRLLRGRVPLGGAHGHARHPRGGDGPLGRHAR